MPSRYLNCVQNVHQLQQHTVEVSFEMTGLPYQWTPVANHSIRQSSARQYWSVLACISDSVAASRPTYDNPVDWDLANSVAIRFFQWNLGISPWSSLGQELLCEQVHRLAERWSCLTGDACSLWLDLADRSCADVELSWVIWRELLLVPGLSSCQQINSLTSAILSAVRADFGLPLPARRVTSVNNTTANFLQRAQAPVFVRITCSYRLSPKSLLAKCLNTHFVFITQFTHHKKHWNTCNKIVPVFQIVTTTSNDVENDVTCQRILNVWIWSKYVNKT